MVVCGFCPRVTENYCVQGSYMSVLFLIMDIYCRGVSCNAALFDCTCAVLPLTELINDKLGAFP